MESKAFEEFVIKRVDEELSKDKDYNLITTKSIEIFKNLWKIMK
jgi:hypothetical protein